MPQALAKHERYLADFQNFERASVSDGDGWLHDIRRKAFSCFDELGFPTAIRGNEKWKYTRVAPIAESVFEYPLNPSSYVIDIHGLRRFAPWHDSWNSLVFINGRYSEGLSSPLARANAACATSLATAMRTHRDIVLQNLGRHAEFQNDGFIALNTAFLHDSAFIYVPPGEVLQAPLHIVFVTAAEERPIVSYPRVLLVAGRHSRLSLVESYVSPSRDSYLNDAVVEIVADEGAQIEHYRLLMESPQAFHVGMTRVCLGQDATFTTTSFSRGAAIARNDLYVLLNAPGASTAVRGLYFTSGAEHIDNHIDIDHAKPHTKSDQLFKGILDGSSRAVFSGKVLVRRDAQKTQSHQEAKNLILSEGAEVDTKPSLEIYADDVVCTHGATAGHIAEDALFYMRSRGLDLETARAMLIHSFAREIIDAVRVEPLRTYLDELFLKTLPSTGVK